MMNLVLNVLLYLLAFYGAVVLAIAILSSIHLGEQVHDPNIRLVLIAKDKEELIEGIIREIHTDRLLKKLMLTERFTVVDMGSADGTKKILEKLKEEYGGMEVLSNTEKEKVFDCYK